MFLSYLFYLIIFYSDVEEKIWAWIGEETPKFYFDNGKQIRFKGHKSLLTKTKELNLNLVNIEENKNEYFFTVRILYLIKILKLFILA